MNEPATQLMQERRLSVITCGIVDHRYGEALEGTHHAMTDGRTLCGRYPRDTRSTIWFGESRVSPGSTEHIESVTCKCCRKSMGLDVRRGDSRVML